MPEDHAGTTTLRPQELQAIYTISKTVARATDTESALDEIIQSAREILIFDNLVLYQMPQSDGLEPTYARAIGRGRFLEADLSWGESIANEVYRTQYPTVRIETLDESNNDRNGIRHFLGLPLKMGEQLMGLLVFIRFGGPEYTPEHIYLAEYVAVHITQLLEHQQLVARIAELEARRRLDTLQEDFIAMVSHELLTPLGFIKGYATTLLREDITWDEQTHREFLSIIDEEADRLRELIDNLLDSSRLQSGTLQMVFQPVRLDTLLRDVSLRGKSIHENMAIELKLNTPGMQIQGDPTRLVQVFDNILNNAAKYAPNTPIIITADKADDGCACIAILDNGPGIASVHMPLLFTRFYRVPGTNNTTRGTGLGLYICRKIIEAHHGEIHAESQVGNGTTFYICLPCDEVTPG